MSCICDTGPGPPPPPLPSSPQNQNPERLPTLSYQSKPILNSNPRSRWKRTRTLHPRLTITPQNPKTYPKPLISCAPGGGGPEAADRGCDCADHEVAARSGPQQHRDRGHTAAGAALPAQPYRHQEADRVAHRTRVPRAGQQRPQDLPLPSLSTPDRALGPAHGGLTRWCNTRGGLLGVDWVRSRGRALGLRLVCALCSVLAGAVTTLSLGLFFPGGSFSGSVWVGFARRGVLRFYFVSRHFAWCRCWRWPRISSLKGFPLPKGFLAKPRAASVPCLIGCCAAN